MTLIEDAVVARLQLKNERFEILVDCEKAMAFKQGRAINIDEILVDDKVFSDSRKGLAVSKKDLMRVFNTDNINEVAKQIILKGVVHTTSDYRDKEREEKRKRIVALIHANAVDPKTGIPHPPTRIENAMKEAKINIDNRRAEDQLVDIVKAIKHIIPISFQTRQMELKIMPKHTRTIYTLAKKMATIQKEDWQNDGSLHMTMEIPAGLRDEFIDHVNSMTHGEVEIKILK